MKTKLALLFCIVTFFVACKKHSHNPNNELIKGTWELRATRYGNIAPATYVPGNDHKLSFGDVNFAEYDAGSVVLSGTYSKSTDPTAQYNVVISSGASYTDKVNIVADTLSLIPTNPDASVGFYVKTSIVPMGN